MEHYDAAVVGAGISGLICANFLAMYGKKVVLLEQNHHAGGNMSGFSRNGFYFDGGDQSFESLGIVFPILRELGVYNEAEWLKVRYRMVSQDFDFFIDSIEEAEANLLSAFPNEARGLKEIFSEIKTVSRFLSENYRPDSFPLLDDFSVGKLIPNIRWLLKLKRWLTYSYRRKVCSVITDPALRNWLAGIGYYKMPYLFFSGFWHIWAYDYWYPVGGMQAFLDKLTGLFQEGGGRVYFNTAVSSIIIKKGRAAGVRTEDGDEITADKVVYAGDYKRLVGGIVPEEYFKPAFVERIRKAGLTEALVSVYLGTNYSPEELEAGLDGGHHVFYFPNYDVLFPDAASDEEIHRRMWTVINFFGKENSGPAPPGKSALVLQTYSSWDWQRYWNNEGDSIRRRPEYRKLKEKVGRELVENAKNILPDLDKRIEYFDVGTPLSLIRFSRNSYGASGGWCYHDKVSPAYRSRRLQMFRTPLKGLFASGHYALWPGGVISAALSGRMVANLAAGRRVLTPLDSAR